MRIIVRHREGNPVEKYIFQLVPETPEDITEIEGVKVAGQEGGKTSLEKQIEERIESELTNEYYDMQFSGDKLPKNEIAVIIKRREI